MRRGHAPGTGIAGGGGSSSGRRRRAPFGARAGDDASTEHAAADAGDAGVMPEGGGAEAERPRKRRREQTPVQRAIGLLSRREHSRRELTAKLEARGIEPDAAREAVERVSDAGWQDESRFAESLMRSRAGAGHGPVRIRAELAMHGLDDALVTSTLASHEGDWTEAARDLLARRFGTLDPRDHARRRKAADFLYRRGFEGDQVRAALAGDPDAD
jgi:regulatory protein